MSTDTLEPRPRGVQEAEKRREAREAAWRACDRIKARYEGGGIHAAITYQTFVADLLTVLAQAESARDERRLLSGELHQEAGL